MAFNEFPKTFYRYNEAGEREGRTFASEAEVEAPWLTWEAFSELPIPAPKKPASASADPVAAGKRLAAAESENARLKDSVKLLEDDAKLKDAELAAKSARVAELEAFIRAVDDEHCPPALKEAIAALFAPVEEAPPAKPKRARPAA